MSTPGTASTTTGTSGTTTTTATTGGLSIVSSESGSDEQWALTVESVEVSTVAVNVASSSTFSRKVSELGPKIEQSKEEIIEANPQHFDRHCWSKNSRYNQVQVPDLEMLCHRSVADALVALQSRSVHCRKLQALSPGIQFIPLPTTEGCTSFLGAGDTTPRLPKHHQFNCFVGQTPDLKPNEQMAFLQMLLHQWISKDATFDDLRTVKPARGSKPRHFHCFNMHQEFWRPAHSCFHGRVLMEPAGCWVGTTEHGQVLLEKYIDWFKDWFKQSKDKQALKLIATPVNMIVLEMTRDQAWTSKSAKKKLEQPRAIPTSDFEPADEGDTGGATEGQGNLKQQARPPHTPPPSWKTPMAKHQHQSVAPSFSYQEHLERRSGMAPRPLGPRLQDPALGAQGHQHSPFPLCATMPQQQVPHHHSSSGLASSSSFSTPPQQQLSAAQRHNSTPLDPVARHHPIAGTGLPGATSTGGSSSSGVSRGGARVTADQPHGLHRTPPLMDSGNDAYAPMFGSFGDRHLLE